MSKDGESGFLERWSRRKQSEAQAETVDKDTATLPEVAALTPEEEEERRLELEEYVHNLPDPETLDYDADFTPFLKDGVPEELKGRALQRLWRSHPTLANLDGLIEYGEDYTNAAMLGKAVRTIYKIGIGMISDEDLALENLAKQKKAEAEVAAANAEPEEPTATEKQSVESSEEETTTLEESAAAGPSGDDAEDRPPVTKEPKSRPVASQVDGHPSAPVQADKAAAKPDKQPGAAHSRRWGMG